MKASLIVMIEIIEQAGDELCQAQFSYPLAGSLFFIAKYLDRIQ